MIFSKFNMHYKNINNIYAIKYLNFKNILQTLSINNIYAMLFFLCESWSQTLFTYYSTLLSLCQTYLKQNNFFFFFLLFNAHITFYCLIFLPQYQTDGIELWTTRVSKFIIWSCLKKNTSYQDSRVIKK